MKSHLREPFPFQVSFLLASPRRAGHVKCLLLRYFSSYPLPDLKGFPGSQSPAPAPAGTMRCSPLQQLPSFPGPLAGEPVGAYSAILLPQVRQKHQEIIISHRHVGGNIWVYPTFFASSMPSCLRSSSSHLALFYRSNRTLSQPLFARINKSSPSVSIFKIGFLSILLNIQK